MAKCKVCGVHSVFIAKEPGVCLDCIRKEPDESLRHAMKAHAWSRAAYGLPEKAPDDPGGLQCNLCVNECRIPEKRTGYCGLRRNEGGKITGVSPGEGKLSWYHDPLPTNCVGDWVCPGGTGAGYPHYAYTDGPEYGYRNLAVFFHACSFNCLFCQNWHFKYQTFKKEKVSAEDFARGIDEKTSCICYFGGDPSPQLPFALKASKLAIEKAGGRILRICWETNGSMQEKLLEEMMEISIQSGGCVKFDLKSYDETLHRVLTGVTNKRTLDNFRKAAETIRERPFPPPLIASTLLVPGYIDEEEVRKIAKFIGATHPDIPYSLLAFYPHFAMSDLPLTPGQLARRCLLAAREEGLRNVRLGNIHLLGEEL